MELLQLRYFYDSARMLSISKTAKKYMVPPTSVSVSIKRLESELGCKLFDRQPNKIVLNENGKKLLESLTFIFGELDRVVGTISQKEDTGEINLLVKTFRSLITDQIVQFKYKNPDTKFKLIANFEQNNIDDYDIIIDTKPNCYDDFECMELCKQQIYIYAAANSPLINRRLRLEELADQQFADFSVYGNYYEELNSACNRFGFSPNVVAQVNDSSCFMRIIGSGVAIGAAGEMYAKISGNKSVAPLDVIDFNVYQKVYIYYKKEKAYGTVRKFIDFLVKNLKEK